MKIKFNLLIMKELGLFQMEEISAGEKLSQRDCMLLGGLAFVSCFVPNWGGFLGAIGVTTVAVQGGCFD